MKIDIKNIAGYEPKFVALLSGGHSSGLVAINAVLRHGKENVILLNHDLSPKIESADIKRFKLAIADYLGMEITYANHPDWKTETPNSLARKRGGFKFNKSPMLCTYELKTEPFYKWIAENDPEHLHTYLYGYDRTKKEINRMMNRAAVMSEIGCKTEFPLIGWGGLEITDTRQINIEPPNTYDNFEHANCKGCHKAGWQHWYIVYVHCRDIWDEAKEIENELGYAIHKDSTTSEPVFLEEREEFFKKMYEARVPTSEHIPSSRFWNTAKKWVGEMESETSYGFNITEMMKYDDIACTSCTG